MRAIRLSEAGGPEVLQAADVPLPEPKPGEVRVRHQAIGLNYIDTYQRCGLYPLTFPSGLGSEAAGVVDEVGEGVDDLATGDRVGYAMVPLGAYAEAHCIPAARAIRLPDHISAEQAAACLLKGMTAEAFLRRCYPVRAGETILVHAAAGGVGALMCQWAKALGAVVIGTAGSQAKADFARTNGCDHVILYRTEDVAGRVREITGGQGVRVAYDSVGADTLDASLASLGRRGWLVSFGNASGPPPPVDPLRLMRGGSLVLTRPTVADYIATRAELLASAQALFEVIGSGSVKVHIGQRFALEDAAEAHRALESRATLGATLLIP